MNKPQRTIPPSLSLFSPSLSSLPLTHFSPPLFSASFLNKGGKQLARPPNLTLDHLYVRTERYLFAGGWGRECEAANRLPPPPPPPSKPPPLSPQAPPPPPSTCLVGHLNCARVDFATLFSVCQGSYSRKGKFWYSSSSFYCLKQILCWNFLTIIITVIHETTEHWTSKYLKEF